jgi:hypothetical protein
VKELRKFIALIFIYYVFIDVLVAPLKIKFPEVTPLSHHYFFWWPPCKNHQPPLLIKNERSLRSRNKKSKHELKISINNESIKRVEKITFLGIVIDEFLTWRDHIDLIAKKIIKCAAIISRIRHFTNLNSLKLIYYALVYPYLTYGNLIWGNAYKSHIQKLVNIQKKIIRLMTFKSYLTTLNQFLMI